MLPLDGSGGRSERNLPFQVARASDRSLVCTRQTLALRPQTPSSGHLVPTTGFHSIPSADKVFFSTFECLRELREWRHSPPPLSIYFFPRQTMRALRPGNQICGRNLGIFFSAKRESCQFLRFGSLKPCGCRSCSGCNATRSLSFFFFQDNFPSVVVFFTGPVAADLSIERRTPGEVQVSWPPPKKKRSFSGALMERRRSSGGGDDPSAAANVRNWTSGTRRTKDSCSLCSAQEKRHKNLQNKESSAAVP